MSDAASDTASALRALDGMPSRPTLTGSPAASRDATLSAADAARALGVQRRTLYAYVSRGLLTSLPDPDHPRRHRYPAAEVRRLKARTAARRDPELGARAAARGALAWGEPVLESGLTLIAAEGLHYRGHDAIALAERVGFEAVAELLWLGTPPSAGRSGWAEPAGYGAGPAADDVAAAVRAAWRSLGRRDDVAPVAAALAALPLAAALDAEGSGRAADAPAPVAAARAGRRILDLLATIAAGPGAPEGAAPPSIAGRLARAWAPRLPGAAALFDAALVLTADHELNAAALAARVVASTGASPYAAVAAGLAALAGPAFGGATARVADLLDEAADAVGSIADAAARDDALRALVVRRRRRGDRLPGFGHRLYPTGDPRARALLRLARERLGAGSATPGAPLAVAEALAAAVHAATGEHPSVDLALVALGRATGAPAHAPLTLFAVGRAAGLVAHAIEQYRAGRVLRARARYVGAQPGVGVR